MSSRLARALLCSASIVIGPRIAGSQDTATTRLAPVIVEVGRGAGRSLLDLPYAVTAQTPDSMRPGQRHLALDEALWLIPGLSVSNRNNPAQDPRISIRGFGARSAFGVRGIRVLRDGIPLTLPDGQTPVDYLDLESVGRVEVMRGSASSLYGNAAGGVVDIRSAQPMAVPLSVGARIWTGTYGSRRYVAKTEGVAGGLGYQANGARTQNEGYRDYSRQRTTNGFARVSYDGAGGSYALQWLGVNTPLAQNPGALTRAQFEADPGMADPLSIRKRARKAVTQSQLGLTARRLGDRGEIEASAYAGTRTLDNPLSFAIVDVGRTLAGASVRATLPFPAPGLSHRLTAGAEAQLQNDERRNFANCNDVPPPTVPTPTCPVVGVERGNLTLDQREIVSSLGAYLRDELELGERYLLTAGLRADGVRFRVEDHFVTATNPDDSGRRLLDAVSPMLGMVARLSASHSAYASVSSAFETPTATELGNRPEGSGGINRELKPQRSTTWELGFKGVGSSGLQYNAAIFTTSVQDELIPFDIPASNGRRFFRNAGRTSRRGAELGGAMSARHIDLAAAYTYARYRFVDFTVGTEQYAGNHIPGIPRQTLQTTAGLRIPFATLVTEASFTDRMFVDDANSESAPGYALFNARLVTRAFARASGAEIVLGVQNILDSPYIASVSVNAAGGKFYEPGSQRAVYIGVTLAGAAPSH